MADGSAAAGVNLSLGENDILDFVNHSDIDYISESGGNNILVCKATLREGAPPSPFSFYNFTTHQVEPLNVIVPGLEILPVARVPKWLRFPVILIEFPPHDRVISEDKERLPFTVRGKDKLFEIGVALGVPNVPLVVQLIERLR